jgi:serine/threonine protein kinase
MGVSAFGPCGDTGIARVRAGLAELARGVSAIHAAGLVHGDLRPANVRVREDGRVVVIDLGLATPLGGAIDPGRSIGVVSHLAPELGAHAIATPSIDAYALGVLLFECLTGDVPFAGTGQDVFVRKQTVSPPHVQLLVSGVPDDLDALCLRLLATDPRHRAGIPDILRVCGESATI